MTPSQPSTSLNRSTHALLNSFAWRKVKLRGADSLLPRSLHVIRADGLEVVDLTSKGALSAGLTMDKISADDWSACQEVGRAVYFLGYQGIRAPSPRVWARSLPCSKLD